MASPSATPTPSNKDIVSIILAEDWSLSIQVSALPLLAIALLVLCGWGVLRWWFRRRLKDFEIDGAELGLGDQKISFKPNDTDRQIAYSIWVELSTRKIGLPIDAEHDVIAEVYDSWYAFFGVTRELIKGVPVSKVRGKSTSKIVDLSVEVLNEGLRPHLTKWQARFRHWYEQQLENKTDAEPQSVQQNFPAYQELVEDLLEVNQKLIAYRAKMNQLVRD
ncbi:hypothetical protein [Roseobacter sp. MH60115]|uniref:hypothetical protein n=1 Tax=Roseobacter sp. MH60115 TaxID=2785324 RepID=UPI0018A320C5|nr:hypothetical protein [Roseobacter sp. MH60115]